MGGALDAVQPLFGEADEVVVVDDHITGVLTEHQAGRCLDMPRSGIQMRGRKSTPGRYFQVANPGTGLGRYGHCRSAGPWSPSSKQCLPA